MSIRKIVSREPEVLAVDTHQASAVIGVDRRTLANWRSLGRGPRYVKLGEGASAPVLYRVADLEAWLEANLVGGGSND